nr:hypothetical protein [Candidatus Sigynarchaeum springense]
MVIIMHVDGSPLPDGPVDSADEAWEEIERYKNTNVEKSYILLEDREPGNFLAEMGVDGWYDFRRVAITPLAAGKWGIIVNDEPEQIVGKEALLAAVKEFFAGTLGMAKENSKPRVAAKNRGK